MKKTLLTFSAILSLVMGWAQTQIGNAGFENWEPVASNEEPVNWNSFLTASGPSFITSFAANQIESSTDVRPGSTGTKSCKIWSRSVLTIVANGNVTLGRINMGSTQASNPDNYNYTVTGDANFSEAYTDSPDSIIFWAKFTPNGHTQNARMKATLHDAYNYRDPEDATSTSNVVASCFKNFAPTSGWQRFAVAFDYSGAASNVAYLLVTFTTNETAGGGAADDILLIDDIELKYTDAAASVETKNTNDILVYLTNGGNTLLINSTEPVSYAVFDLSGAQVINGFGSGNILFDQPNGVYLIQTEQNGKTETTKVVKY